MTEIDTPLSDRERLLTAYLDDALEPGERQEFERMMAEDAALAREVLEYRHLVDLSRTMAIAEPQDHEIRRFWARLYNRTEWRLGWVLVVAGAVVLSAESLYLLVTTDRIGWVMKAGILSVLLGAALLLWNTVRLKIRTIPFDRYRGVMR